MNVALNVKLEKKLEKNDILVYSNGYWTNLSHNEYLVKIKEDIYNLQKADEETNHDLMQHLISIEKLRNRDLFIAKSIYDNYIERGLIDENPEFDEKFYDFIFNDYQLQLEECDKDFLRILEKVRKENE